MACEKISLIDQARSTKFKNSLEGFLKAFNANAKVQYIIAPSMSFDKRLLEGIDGIEHYELRSFWEILRVKRKNTYVTFVSSEEVSDVVFEHFIDVFKLSAEEISRITFIRCPREKHELSLTKNILNNPKCIERIKSSLKTTNIILECFVRTGDEKKLADLLGVPSWYNHPQLDYFHTKSGNRFIVGKDARMPKGISDLFSKESVIKALIKLKNDNLKCEFFMVKF